MNRKSSQSLKGMKNSVKGLLSYDGPLATAFTAIGDCFCLSVLWIVFSLPVVTIGAATTAMYAAAYHVIRRKEGGLWRFFWGAFRENFRRATLLWLVVLAVLALLTVDIFLLRGIRLSGDKLGYLYYVVWVLWCLALTRAVYVAAYTARFNGSVREVLKLSLMLIALHPIRMLGVMIPVLACIALSLLMPLMPLVLPAAVFVIITFTMERVFRLHMRPEDLEREEKSQSERI